MKKSDLSSDGTSHPSPPTPKPIPNPPRLPESGPPSRSVPPFKPPPPPPPKKPS